MLVVMVAVVVGTVWMSFRRICTCNLVFTLRDGSVQNKFAADWVSHVERIDKSIGEHCAGGSGYCATPWRQRPLPAGRHSSSWCDMTTDFVSIQ